MSGSPILAEVSGELYVVGIHAYGVSDTQQDYVEDDYNDYNKATRIKSVSKTFLEDA